jgi:hypothetical protein
MKNSATQSFVKNESTKKHADFSILYLLEVVFMKYNDYLYIVNENIEDGRSVTPTLEE